MLEESGVAWTSLRNGFYAHSLQWLLGSWRDTGVISVPGTGPVSWTARQDAAEAAALILASDGWYDGSVTLTAISAPTFDGIATIASALDAASMFRCSNPYGTGPADVIGESNAGRLDSPDDPGTIEFRREITTVRAIAMTSGECRARAGRIPRQVQFPGRGR